MNDKVVQVVAKTKEAVARGTLKSGQVITAKDIINICPGVHAPSVGIVVNSMANAGLLKSLGSKQFEISSLFDTLNVNECLEKVDERPRERKYSVRSPRVEQPAEPEKPRMVTVNFLDGWRVLTPHEIPEFIKFGIELARNEDIPGIIMFGIHRLYLQANSWGKSEDRYTADIKKLEEDNDRLRQELKNERERTMELRTEINKARGNVTLSRIADRKITIETQPASVEDPLPKKPGEMMVEEKSLKDSKGIIRRHSLDPER